MLLPLGSGGCSRMQEESAAAEQQDILSNDDQTRSAAMTQERISNREVHPDSTSAIVLGAGCFWCVEAVFERLDGVVRVEAGYAGGDVDNPSYEAVCSGSTGHAEVARVTFDPAVISLEDILSVFWNAHDPTTLNRQGADIGTQYRSAIFYHDDAQRRIAEQSRSEAQRLFDDAIVTEVAPLDRFWIAEHYHQDYYDNNRNAPYCRVVIAPKLKKLNLE